MTTRPTPIVTITMLLLRLLPSSFQSPLILHSTVLAEVATAVGASSSSHPSPSPNFSPPLPSRRVGRGRRSLRHRKLLRAAEGARVIPGRYIVVLSVELSDEPHAAESAASVLIRTSKVEQVYDAALKGFTVSETTDDDLLRVLESSHVAYAEEDHEVRVSSMAEQTDAPWGLDRIDQSVLPLDGSYHYTEQNSGDNGNFHGDPPVNIYILDTGIAVQHKEFQGRAVCGRDFTVQEPASSSFVHNPCIDGKSRMACPESEITISHTDTETVYSVGHCHDANGHGTAVASIVGGRTYGVAKNRGVNLVAVKVFSGNGLGTVSNVIRGIDWVEQQRLEGSRGTSAAATTAGRTAVANLSMESSFSLSLNAAVDGAVAAGVVMVVAAGNDGRPACQDSPASAEAALTVAATNRRDERDYLSNYGDCVDVFAPGQDIPVASLQPEGTDGVPHLGRRSGTSMAAPLVAGLAALYLQRHPEWSPEQVKRTIVEDATPNLVRNPGPLSPNLMVSTRGIMLLSSSSLTVSPKTTATTQLEEKGDPSPPDPAPFEVTEILLLNGETGLPAAGITPNATISLQERTLPKDANFFVNLQAMTTHPWAVGSVQFVLEWTDDLTGDRHVVSRQRSMVDNVPPFCFAGDSPPATMQLDLYATHVLTVTPYAGLRGDGAKGRPMAVSFRLIP